MTRNDQIDAIEKHAMNISGREQMKARALIVKWSSFNVDGREMSIANKLWPQVSDKWVNRIYINANSAWKKYAKKHGITVEGETIEMELKPRPDALMTGEGYDNGADLPF